MATLWDDALALLRPAELMVVHAHRQAVRLEERGLEAVLEVDELQEARPCAPRAEAVADALREIVPDLHELDAGRAAELRAADALAVPARELGDYGVVLSGDGEPDPGEWRLIVEGPVMLMSSATGMDGRGFRYFVGVWPGPGPGQAAFVMLSMVKLYASGGREGVIFRNWYGHDIRDALGLMNGNIAAAAGSPRFAGREFQPPGFRPLDEDAVIESLRRGERVEGPGWNELDAAALHGYHGQAPEHWAPPGEHCVMRFRRDLRWQT